MGEWIHWHDGKFRKSCKDIGGIQSRPSEILMYHSLKVFQCLNWCSFDFCWFVFAGWRLFMLDRPHVPLVYVHSPLFVLVQPLLVCWFVCARCCSFVLVPPRVPSICAHSPLFALVQPRVLSIHACLTSDQALLVVTTSCDNCRTGSHCNDKS